MLKEAEYHERRAAQEKALAQSAPEDTARMRHAALALLHAERAALLRNGRKRRPILRIVNTVQEPEGKPNN